MTHGVLQRLKDSLSFAGRGTKAVVEQGTPFYNASEIALLQRQLKENSALALDAARRGGAKLHPRLQAIKDKRTPA